MDHIDTHLATSLQDDSLSVALHATLAIGKKTLNRYYNKTDLSEIYRVAMGMYYFHYFTIFTTYFSVILVLHPRHKMKYFKSAGWEEDWIQTARKIIRSEFDRTYAFMDIEVETQAGSAEDKVCVYILI